MPLLVFSAVIGCKYSRMAVIGYSCTCVTVIGCLMSFTSSVCHTAASCILSCDWLFVNRDNSDWLFNELHKFCVPHCRFLYSQL